jgi:serine protease AprX
LEQIVLVDVLDVLGIHLSGARDEMAGGNLKARRRVVRLLALAAAAVVAAVLAPVASAAPQRRSIVVFAPSTTAAQRVATVRAAGGRVVRDLHLIDGLGVVASRRAAWRLARLPRVRSVTPDVSLRPTAVRPMGPSTPAHCEGVWSEWCPGALATAFVQSTRADKAWADPRYDATGAGVGVAVIDTGVDGGLADFRRSDGGSRVIASAVVNPAATTADDLYGHGTHVAGLLAGDGRRLDPADSLYNRYIGTAPDANIVSIKVSDDDGNASVMDVIDGLQFAVDFKDVYGIRVVNLSLSSTQPRSYRTDPLDAAAEAAWFSGLVVVTAAGNRGDASDAVSYPPANDPYVLSVGGVDDQGTKATNDDAVVSWSSRGVTQDGFAKPDLVAPAAHMVAPLAPGSLFARLCPGCVVDGRYFRMGGTSMASPVVAGIAADLLSAHPDWTPDMVKQALVASLRPVGGGRGEAAADTALSGKLARVTVNAGLAPNELIDPSTHAVDYARASWGRASWSEATGALRASWGRASWRCELCGGGTAANTLRASWRRASWGRASWSGFFGGSPLASGELSGGSTGAMTPDVPPTG